MPPFARHTPENSWGQQALTKRRTEHPSQPPPRQHLPHLSAKTLSLCTLTLLPFMFQERAYQPLFSILLQTCSQPGAEFRPLYAINSNVCPCSFV